MAWGVSSKASEEEKIFTEFSDYLGGLNSCAVIDYSTYSEIWDMGRDMFEKLVELMKRKDIYGKCDMCDYGGSCDDCCRWDKHADCYCTAENEECRNED